jgi:K+-transporting ATPase c subunit
VPQDDVRALVDDYTDGGPLTWIMGEERVNVLKLNIALDETFGRAEQ